MKMWETVVKGSSLQEAACMYYTMFALKVLLHKSGKFQIDLHCVFVDLLKAYMTSCREGSCGVV